MIRLRSLVRPITGPVDIRGATAVLEQGDGPQRDRRRGLLEQMTQAGPALEATAAMRDLDDCTLQGVPTARFFRQPRRV